MKNDKDRYWDCLDQAMEASHGGRTDEALAWLEEALKARPGGAEAHNGRGELLWDEGRVDESIYEFERAADADPKFAAAHLNRVELLIEEMGEFQHALDCCDELLAGQPDLPRPDRSFQAEVYYLKSKALFYLDDLEGAIFLVRRAIKAGAEQPVYRPIEGQSLCERGRFEEARRVLDQAGALDPDSPHAVYHLALVAERLRDEELAESGFSRANALDPAHYPIPVSVEEDVFEEAVQEALSNLPRSIREYVENVHVAVMDWPSDELLERENVSPQILGLFLGVPRTAAASSHQPEDLDRVLIFKRNLEKICVDREDLIDQVQITVRHEIGHYLGLDEDDLERLGLA